MVGPPVRSGMTAGVVPCEPDRLGDRRAYTIISLTVILTYAWSGTSMANPATRAAAGQSGGLSLILFWVLPSLTQDTTLPSQISKSLIGSLQVDEEYSSPHLH